MNFMEGQSKYISNCHLLMRKKKSYSASSELGGMGSNYFVAQSGYVNDYRTFGVLFAFQIGVIPNTKGLQSLALGNAQGLNKRIDYYAKSALLIGFKAN